MGAAKNRGPRAARVAEGIAKREAAEAERQRQFAAVEAAMTAEQKARRNRARYTLAMMSCLSVGLNR